MAIHFDHWPPLWKSIFTARLKYDAVMSQPPDRIPVGDQVEMYIEEALIRDGFIHKENQETAGRWCRETFPEYNTYENRALALLEEVVELLVATNGFGRERIQEVVDAVLKKCEGQKKAPPGEAVPEEAGDALICLYAFAAKYSFDLHLEADRKMLVNRSRPLEYYQKKTQQKKEAGLRLGAKAEDGA